MLYFISGLRFRVHILEKDIVNFSLNIIQKKVKVEYYQVGSGLFLESQIRIRFFLTIGPEFDFLQFVIYLVSGSGSTHTGSATLLFNTLPWLLQSRRRWCYIGRSQSAPSASTCIEILILPWAGFAPPPLRRVKSFKRKLY